MHLKDMTIDQLLERRSAIATEIEAPDADLDALETEARAINEELEARRTAAAQRENVRGMVPAEDIKADLLVAAAMKLVKDNAVVAND